MNVAYGISQEDSSGIGEEKQRKDELCHHFRKRLEELSREKPQVCRFLVMHLQLYGTEVAAGNSALTVWDVVYHDIRERVAQREARGETMSEEQFIDLLFERATPTGEFHAETFFRRLQTG